MKLNLKIVALLFILIYCLSPLAAADFTQNETDAADGDKIVDNDVKSVDNTTEDDGNKTANVQVEDNKDDDSKCTNGVLGSGIHLNPCLQVSVCDVDKGSPINVHITAKKGVRGDITVKVAGSSISGKINDGEADIQIDSTNLPAGQYNVVVDYYGGSSGGYSYDSSTESATFNVNKMNPGLKIKIDDINVGDEANVVVTTNSAYSGDVKLRIESDSYTVKVTDGQGSIKLSNLSNGVYRCKVLFEENDFFIASQKGATFKVNKIDPELSIKANVQKDFLVKIVRFEISTNPDFEGPVEVQIDGIPWGTQSVSDGHCTFCNMNMAAGNHEIKIEYKGDEKYLPSQSSASFTV